MTQADNQDERKSSKVHVCYHRNKICDSVHIHPSRTDCHQLRNVCIQVHNVLGPQCLTLRTRHAFLSPLLLLELLREESQSSKVQDREQLFKNH